VWANALMGKVRLRRHVIWGRQLLDVVLAAHAVEESAKLTKEPHVSQQTTSRETSWELTRPYLHRTLPLLPAHSSITRSIQQSERGAPLPVTRRWSSSFIKQVAGEGFTSHACIFVHRRNGTRSRETFIQSCTRLTHVTARMRRHDYVP